MSFFNSLKKTVGNLMRTEEQTKKELTDAIGKSSLPFTQEDNAYVLFVGRSKELLYPGKITLTPQKATISGKFEILVEAPADGSYTKVVLPQGFTAKPGKKSYDIEFDLDAANFLSDFVSQIENLKKLAADTARKAGIPQLSADTWMLQMAVEDMPLTVRPAGFNKNFLIMNESDKVPAKWYIFADIKDNCLSLVTALRAEIDEQFKKEGLESDHAYPLTWAKAEISLNKLADVNALENAIAAYISKVTSVLAKFAASKDFKPEKLNYTVFNEEMVVKGFTTTHKDIVVLVDDEGDVKLSIPPTDSFAHERFGWLYISPVKVVVENGVSGLVLPANAAEVVDALGEELKGVKFSLSDENKLRIKVRIYPEDFSAIEANDKVFDAIDKALSSVQNAWVEVLSRLGMPVKANQFFDADKVRKQFSKAPSYVKTDNDGDMKFELKGDSSFRPERFAWMYLTNKERITMVAGLLLNDAWSGVNLDEAISKFNAEKTGFEAYKLDDTVRIRRRFLLADYPGDNPTSKLIPDLDKGLINIFEALKKLAAVMNIKTKYYVPDLADMEATLAKNTYVKKCERSGDKVKFEFVPTNATDGTELAHSELIVEVSAKATTFTSEVKLGKQMDNKSDTAALASKLAAAIGNGAKPDNGYGYFSATFTVPNMSFDDRSQFYDKFLEAFHQLDQYTDKGADLALDKINADIAEERARRERREAEERERERRRAAEAEAERQRKLNAYFNYTMYPGNAIRDLQESFTEDYPYLRIAVFMVQTGQKADRSGGTISSYSSDTTFSQIRSFKGQCTVRIAASATPESLEREFRSKSGLVIKICYNDRDDDRIYISKDSSYYKKTIYDLNKEFKEKGFYTADIS